MKKKLIAEYGGVKRNELQSEMEKEMDLDEDLVRAMEKFEVSRESCMISYKKVIRSIHEDVDMDRIPSTLANVHIYPRLFYEVFFFHAGNRKRAYKSDK